MEVKHEADGGRCEALMTGLASLHDDMRGERKEGGEKVLAKKMTDLDSAQVVSGWLVGTNECTISLLAEEVHNWRELQAGRGG